jgi:hypothetical protein
MSKKRISLQSWIEEALSDQDKVDTTSGEVRPCSAMTALHIKNSGPATDEVHAVRLIGKSWDPGVLAKLFQRKIEAYAQNLPGIQSFVVEAFYGQPEPEAKHHVRCIDGELVIGDEYVVEAPTEKGIVGMMMRHAEHKDQMLMAMVRATVGGWAEERHKLQSEVNDAYAIVRELMMKQADNSHAYAMQQLQFARTTGERQTLMKMVPALANGLTGKDIFPKSDQDTTLIDMFARRVKPEQLEMLVQAQIIPKELYPALVARFAETHERDQAERQELARVPPTSPSDELNS